jgi:hypothetical protein
LAGNGLTTSPDVMLVYNTMTPIQAQKGVSQVTLDGAEAALMALRIPVLVTHGRKDRLFRLAVSEYTARVVTGARLSIYDRAGHAPFFEETRAVQLRTPRTPPPLMTGVVHLAGTAVRGAGRATGHRQTVRPSRAGEGRARRDRFT